MSMSTRRMRVRFDFFSQKITVSTPSPFEGLDDDVLELDPFLMRTEGREKTSRKILSHLVSCLQEQRYPLGMVVRAVFDCEELGHCPVPDPRLSHSFDHLGAPLS